MFRSHRCRLCLLLVFCLQLSCAKERGERQATFPVTGQVTVDGKAPTAPIQITCHHLDEMDTKHPTYPACMTGPDGKFSISTYEQGDGVPFGNFALTFFMGKYNLISNSYGGPDALKDRYTDPKKSEVTFEIDGSGPVDLGTINLTTK